MVTHYFSSRFFPVLIAGSLVFVVGCADSSAPILPVGAGGADGAGRVTPPGQQSPATGTGGTGGTTPGAPSDPPPDSMDPAGGGDPPGTGIPPAGDTPPAGGGDMPPAGGGDMPPAGGGDTPPAGGGDIPPVGGDTPPGGDMMPPVGGMTPPATGGGMPIEPTPPAGGNAEPPPGQAPTARPTALTTAPAVPAVGCQPTGADLADGADNDCDGLTDELTVCATGDAAFRTVATAVAAATAGAAIEVCAGTYAEAVNAQGKSLYIRGAGAEATVIDATSLGAAAVTVQGAPGAGLVLEGLGVRGARVTTDGGGVRCDGSKLSLFGVAITANRAANGGGLYANGCEVNISASRFEGNEADDRGAGVLLVNSTTVIAGTKLLRNKGVHGGGVTADGGWLALRDSEATSNEAALQGGGLYLNAEGLIDHNTFSANSSGWTGGGVYVTVHTATFTNNTVTASTSVNDGAGIYVDRSRLVITSNRFTENRSGDDGGGIRIFESNARIEGNWIEKNHASDSGGGIRISHVQSELNNNTVVNNSSGGNGAGLDLDNDSSIVRGGLISGNVAGGNGGGVHSAIYPWLGGRFEDVQIVDNRAAQGGGLAMESNLQAIALKGVLIRGNRATYGAAMAVNDTEFTMTNSVVAQNIASGGVGGLLLKNVKASMSFSVFYANSGGAGTALWADASAIVVSNNIISSNDGTAVVTSNGSVPQWRYNNVYPAVFTGMTDPTGLEGNISADPFFVSAATGDFHLAAGSVCLDAGDPAMKDADGSRADLGRYGGP